jgi:hypothetical protein
VQVFGQILVQEQLELRKVSPQRGQHTRQQERRDRGDDAELQRPL